LPEVRKKIGADLPAPLGVIAQVPWMIAAVRFEEGSIALDVDAACSEGTCATLADMLTTARGQIAQEPRLVAIGLADAVAAATIGAADDRVRLGVVLPVDRLRALLSPPSPR
jgi:hypothetical protein